MPEPVLGSEFMELSVTETKKTSSQKQNNIRQLLLAARFIMDARSIDSAYSCMRMSRL